MADGYYLGANNPDRDFLLRADRTTVHDAHYACYIGIPLWWWHRWAEGALANATFFKHLHTI